MNREAQKAARGLVQRLRAHAQIEDADHALDLRQAANEIEDGVKLLDAAAYADAQRIGRKLEAFIRELVMSETGFDCRIDYDDNLSGPVQTRVGASAISPEMIVRVELVVHRRTLEGEFLDA